VKGVDPNYLNALRKAVPKGKVGVDLNVPTESEIVESIKKLSSGIPVRYQAFYNLALDSRLRMSEVDG